MKLPFLPFSNVGPIYFGSHRKEIRGILQNEFNVIKRNEFAENSSDYYEYLGLFIEYNKEEICEAIECTSDSNLYYKDQNLLTMTYSEIRLKYDLLSEQIEIEEDIAVTYHDLGFGVTKQYGTGRVESIIAFSEGYW